MATNAGEIKTRMSVDGSGFKAGIDNARAYARNFGADLRSSIGGAIGGAFGGIATVGGLAMMGREVAAHVRELKKQHDATGISIHDLQVYEDAADDFGITLSDVTAAVRKLTAMRSQALAGGENSETAQAFKKLGVSFAELKSKSPAEVFKQIHNELGSMADKSVVADAMVKVLGKSVLQMNSFFSETFDAMNAEAIRNGVIATDQTVEELNSNLLLADDHWKGFRQTVAMPVFNQVLQALNWMVSLIGTAADTYSELWLRAEVGARRFIGYLGGEGGALSKALGGAGGGIIGRIAGGLGGISEKEAENQLAGIRKMAAEQQALRHKQATDPFTTRAKKGDSISEADEDGLDSEGKGAESRAQKLVSLEKQIAAEREKKKLAGMSAEERLKYLAEKRLEIQQKIAALESTTTQKLTVRQQHQKESLEADNAAAARKSAEAQAALAAVQAKQAALTSADPGEFGWTDSLAQIESERKAGALAADEIAARAELQKALDAETKTRKESEAQLAKIGVKPEGVSLANKLQARELELALEKMDGDKSAKGDAQKPAVATDALTRIGAKFGGTVDPAGLERRKAIEQRAEMLRAVNEANRRLERFNRTMELSRIA